MIVLTLRTDKPEAELGLFDDSSKLAYEVWKAHRQLSATLNRKIEEVLKSQGRELKDIKAIVCYKGPGSFTGLRIGLSVANALASALSVPIVGVENEEQWLQRGIQAVKEGRSDRVVLPEYGGPAHTTG